MATVYLAIQETLGRQVALKVMNPDLATDKGFRERFVREGRIVARFRHPRIVTVYDFWKHGDMLLLSMEYLPGGSLKERIEHGLPRNHIIDIAVLVAEALAYAHQFNIVHRDIKPANILFREDDTPVLTDFGIARPLEETTQLTQSGFSIGSPRYMSPEQLLGRSIDHRSDIYSLGIVFFEMLTGNVPWSDTDNPYAAALKHCTEPAPELPEDQAEYRSILRKLLAKKPADRYENALAFAHELRSMTRDDDATQATNFHTIAHRRSRFAEPRRNTRRKSIIATALLLASVGFGIGGYWLSDNLPPTRDIRRLPWLVLPQVEGKRPIADKVEALAIELLKKEDYERAIDTIDRGFETAPGDPRLVVLKRIVDKRWTLNQCLRAARNHLENRQLESASREIMKGLRIAPSHTELLVLQDELASTYHTLAQHELGTGDLESSRAQVDQGLRLLPNHLDLVSLRDQLAQRSAAIVRSNEILLAEVNRLKKKGHWKEAMTAIEAGLAVAPAQSKLISAKAEIEKGLIRSLSEEADRLCTEAQRTSDNGALASCQRIIRDGLLLVPDAPALVALRALAKDVETQIEREHARLARNLLVEKQEKATELLAECEAHYRADRLTTGPGETAFDCYQSVLELDPENAQALEGVAKIADRYAGWASTKIDQRNPASAHLYLERLLSVSSDHPQLPELRKRLARVERSMTRSSGAPTNSKKTKRKSKTTRRPAPSHSDKKASRPIFGNF